jgi:hypothetical protein
VAGIAAGGPARAGLERLADREIRAATAIARRALDLSTEVADRWQQRSEALADDLAALAREGDPGRVEGTLAALDADRAALLEENAAAGQQQQALAMELESLREYAYLAECLEGALGDPDLSAIVRSRRQHILAQIAIAEQGSQGLRLIVAGNAAAISQIGAAARSALERLKRRVPGS